MDDAMEPERSPAAEPVAIIGMSCRFAPDLDSPEKLWEFLLDGRSSIGEMPGKRWDPYAATSPQATAILRGTTRVGSFLDDIEGFDAEFFGITPREAEYIDPQQRVMLELAWEALGNAGLPPNSLNGTEAGVFVAANSNDYGRRLLEDITRTGAWAVNGTTYYGIANRISYFLDLRGPSMAVDTACAGSLTAVHVACQSLRGGETPLAIVGGINIMATPALYVALDAAGATSPDGRSKAFDSRADGYGRGEGAGVLVLKRLSDAQRDGDPILALVLGSGVFQDGRSDGMMAPDGDAQEHMLRQIYRRADIAPRTVGYVEAHGTGTPVGDREEARALAAVFGRGRPAGSPCLIGSVKPNIGHTEAASGVAGIIKTLLALNGRTIPPSLHQEANPDLAWEASGLRLVAEPAPWPAAGPGPRRAGVSSYGVGGTTSHVILQEAPLPARPRPRAVTVKGHSSHGRATALYPLSAVSEAGLQALAGRTADRLDTQPGISLASVGHTLARRRSHLPQRAGVIAENTAELTERLRALAEGRRAPGVVTARAVPGSGPGVVWVFSGHGAQWEGMGRELLNDEPVFAAAMDALKGVFLEEMGWTPREAIVDGGPWTAARAQAMTFAMQIGLAEVWRRHGVTPAAVIGHSVGEIAAAAVAGTLDLPDAARFACRRASALQRLEGLGGMALVSLPFDEVRKRLEGRTDVVAAIASSPGSSVVSGDNDAVAAAAAQWRDEGLDVFIVETDVAFHSPHVDTVVAEVAAAAGEMASRPARMPLYTTALTDPRSHTPRDGAYWAANLRQPVRFADAVEAAIEDGHRVFLEISSHPVVAHSVKETLRHLDVTDGLVTHSTRRARPEMETLLEALAELHCHGVALDWIQEHPAGDLVTLPPVAWQHRPYWIFPAGSDDTGPGGGHDPAKHSLLGGRMTVSGAPTRQVWQTHLDLGSRPYPQDHLVVGVEITPAASIINSFMLAAARDAHLPGLTDVVLRTPLAVTPPRIVQIVLAESSVRLASRVAGEQGGNEDEEHEWITHTTATIDATLTPAREPMAPDAVRARCPQEWDRAKVDDLFITKGVGGYAFPWNLDELSRSDEEQLAVLTLETDPENNPVSWAHVIDGALTISAVLVTPEDAPRLWMSCRIGSVLFHGEPPARITVHSTRSAHSPLDSVDVLVCDDEGRTVCEVQGLKFATLQDQGTGSAAARDLVHEIVWRPLEPAAPAAARAAVERIILLGDDPALETLAGRFAAAAVPCVRAGSPDALRGLAPSGTDAVLVSPARTRDGHTPDTAAEHAAWTLIGAAQTLIAEQPADLDLAAPRPRLWTVTVGVRESRDEAALSHGPLWGVSRIIAGEHPGLWGGVLDLPDSAMDPAPDTAERLLEILRTAAGREDVISLTGDGAEVARLARLQRPADGPALQCRPSGTYLITGGLGGLGLEVARRLADRGATRLVLAGRTGLPPRAQWDTIRDTAARRQIDAVLALEASGVTVRALALDITDADRVAAALEPSALGMPPIRGIVHAAGVTRDAMLGKVDRDDLHTVLGPKAVGALVLHRLFPAGTLDFFVLFSSCGQFARLTGQTSYAAANSFLDTLAAVRHATGHRETTSIGWTSWLGIGMAAAIEGTMLEANSRGLEAVTATEAFRAWTFADRFRSPYQAVLRMLPLPPNAPRPPMFRELTATADGSGQAQAHSGFDLGPAGRPESELLELVAADLREQVAAELNLAVEDVDPRRPLVEMGIDSVMTVALRARFTRRYGLDLPPTILWNKPTVGALAAHLVENLRPPATAEEGAEESEAPLPGEDALAPAGV